MKRSLLFWQWLGFLFTGIAGVLLHFLFDWTGQSVLVAPFAPVNESIWEHGKLLFFPMLLFAVIQSHFLRKDYPGFWCAKRIGILLSVLLIPILYYTLTGIFGPLPAVFNIVLFYVVTAVSYFTETQLLKQGNLPCPSPKRAVGCLVLLAVLFGILTFSPPRLPLFQDPVTYTYGYPPTAQT